jgi:hypothetical protein
MKTLKIALAILAAGMILMNPCSGQTNNDSILARKAYRYLKKANVVNGISIGFGLASNIEMIALGGFPLETDDGGNAPANLSHMFLAVGRVVTSISPATSVAKARDVLQPWRESPEMAASCKRLFSYLDAAQVLTALAPVLCVSGGIMMFTASLKMEEHYDYSNGYYSDSYITTSIPGIKTLGWVLVGAGLASSISSAVLISLSKKELTNKFGSFKLAAGPAGVGVKYSLPAKH